MKNNKAVVLLSSGLDSTYNLYVAKQELDVILALTFDYGQRAASQEIKHSIEICRRLNVLHKTVDLPFFKIFTETSLINRNSYVPVGDRVKIDDRESSEESAKSVWVPNRNGIILNIAAGFAEGLGAQWVIPGFNAEEAETFPDNTEEFLEQLDNCWSFSTAVGVRGRCYTTALNKSQIVRSCLERSVDFSLMWPCYFAGDAICRECESCQRFLRALDENGVAL